MDAQPDPAFLTARFTDFDGFPGVLGSLGGSSALLFADVLVLDLRDCAIGPGTFQFKVCDGCSARCANNLFERTRFELDAYAGDNPLAFYNNTLRNSSVTFNNWASSSSWYVRDNFFANCAVGVVAPSLLVHDHNAYLNTSVLPGTTSDNVTVTTADFQTGPLGNYYPASTNFFNKGSRNADVAGLYHYTTSTNQVKETNSVVDIGFHYVAVNTTNQPVDTDGDGLADYFEDGNGNGSYAVGDLASWTNADTDGGGVNDGYEYAHGGNPTTCADDYFVDPGMSVGILDSALTRTYGSLPTNWNYFVLPESVKEALRSDGTTFAAVGDCQIAGGLLLPNGKPRFPILIALGAEAISDAGAAALTNYVAAGGFVLVGSSSFTRHADGSYRTNFALSAQMGLTCSPSAANWVNSSNILKRASHRLVNDFPDELLMWRMPSSSEETSWGTCEDGHTYAAPHQVWNVNTNNTSAAQVLITGDVAPMLAAKQYGNGYFIYHSELNPLIAHGGNGPGMYAYMIFKRAIEWAFENAQKPVVKLSPWPYQYNAAFMVRHDLEDFANEISDITNSAYIEYTNGAKGDYYFCTGRITNEANYASIVTGLRQAVSNYGATIGPHNGGLPNPRSAACNLTNGSYEYWHWGPDEALDTTNGYAYASNSLAISFSQIESWLTNYQTANPRVWVAPYFNATREDCYRIQEQLNVKITGDQKLTPFPAWTLSTQTDSKRYALLSEPASDWFVNGFVAQSLDPWHPPGVHTSQTMHEGVDFYYANGFLINFYSHGLSTGFRPSPETAGYLIPEYCGLASIWWTSVG